MDFSDADYFDLAADWHRSQRNEKLLREFTAKTEINWITPRREGKACLVLDLDHTILDFSRIQDGPTALDAVRRPHLQAFLARAYQQYDLVVWLKAASTNLSTPRPRGRSAAAAATDARRSQTSWRWLEVKLTSLGLLSNAAYKFCFVLDKSSMFRIVSKKKDGSEFRHSVKPLQLIWTKCEGWDASNTVHVDDLSRNFARDRATDPSVAASPRCLSPPRRSTPRAASNAARTIATRRTRARTRSSWASRATSRRSRRRPRRSTTATGARWRSRYGREAGKSVRSTASSRRAVRVGLTRRLRYLRRRVGSRLGDAAGGMLAGVKSAASRLASSRFRGSPRRPGLRRVVTGRER